MNLKKSGRPQKTVIDILKTLVWFEYVAVQVFQTYQKRNVTPSQNEKKSNKASLKSLEVFLIKRTQIFGTNIRLAQTVQIVKA